MDATPRLDEPVVAAEGLVKRYGSRAALDGVSFRLDAPAIGLLGANGAGKSTLMKAMLGLLQPDEGRLTVLGHDATDAPASLRRRLGYMPEGNALPLDMTARDMIVLMAELRGLPRQEAVLRASEVLFQVGLEEERSRLIRTFSTGMRQRTKLAQALVHSPELVILDEPTNGLDPRGRAEMLDLVRRLSQDLGIRVLMSSHVLEDVVRTCDAVVVLREGRVAASGTVADLEGADAGEVRVRVTGDPDALRVRLVAAGLDVRPADGAEDALIVAVAGEADLDRLRDAAAEAGVGVRELRPAGGGAAEALVEAITGAGVAGARQEG